MNKTRKEIIELIELIEPCMDKEDDELFILSEYKVGRKSTASSSFAYENQFLYPSEVQTMYDEPFRYEVEHIRDVGHYDITAVLKYIDKVFGLYLLSGGNHIQVIGPNERCVGFIPNKPLHLYTEEEIKDLLKLLKKLGQNKK